MTNKLIRITMIILSWESLIKSTPEVPVTRKTAIKCFVRAAQHDSFQPQFTSVSLSKELPKCSPLDQYSPMPDSVGILRVGGRLAKAKVPFNFKHPMIITDHILPTHWCLIFTRRRSNREATLLPLLYVKIGFI